MATIKFGTDGWRAVIAEGFTFANLDRVTQATADFWKANPIAGTEPRVIVGFDRRFLSDQFAARAAEILCANGFEVVLTTQPTPTPAVSFAVKAQRAVGGVMITASHNPPAFNGYKLKAHFGGSAEPGMCKAIEGLLDWNPVPAGSATQPESKDIRPSHFKAVKKLVDFKLIARSKLRSSMREERRHPSVAKLQSRDRCHVSNSPIEPRNVMNPASPISRRELLSRSGLGFVFDSIGDGSWRDIRKLCDSLVVGVQNCNAI